MVTIMNVLRAIRNVSWAVVFIAVGVIGTTLLGWRVIEEHEHPRKSDTNVATIAIGGSFTMVDHTGQTVTEVDFAGRPFVMFFGFTHCPDICPTTLSWLSDLVEHAAPEGKRPPILFVTVDPERDTPEAMAAYIGSFGPGIIGLTGSLEQLEVIAKAWKVYFKKVPLEGGGYTMDHSASIFLMGEGGKFRGTLDLHDTTRNNNLKKLTALVNG